MSIRSEDGGDVVYEDDAYFRSMRTFPIKKFQITGIRNQVITTAHDIIRFIL